jgi:hypothetical protein
MNRKKNISMIIGIEINKLSYFLFITFLFVAQLGLAGGFGEAKFPYSISGIDLTTNKSYSIDLSQTKVATVIVFLSAKCPCSNSHIPSLKILAKEFSMHDIAFVGIHSNLNENIIDSFEYFRGLNLNFPVLQDINNKLANAFEAYKTPHVFIVSPKLDMLFQGGIDDSRIIENAKHHFLYDALVAIRDGKLPKERNVRVLGCEIRRS